MGSLNWLEKILTMKKNLKTFFSHFLLKLFPQSCLKCQNVFFLKKAPYFLVSVFKGLTYQTTKAFKANKRKILKFERSERYWIRSYYLPITNAYHFMIKKKENLPLDRTGKNIKKLLFFQRKKLEATTINFLGIKFTTS